MIASAFLFDGSANSFAAASPNQFNVLTASYAVWFRGVTDTAGSIFSMSVPGASKTILDISVGDGRTGGLTNELITVVHRNDADSNYDIYGYTTATRTELFDGHWHHIGITCNQTATVIYLDGVSKTITVGGGSTNNGKFGHSGLTATNCLIGSVNGTGTPGILLKGSLAYPAVWTSALTAADMLAMWRGTLPRLIQTSTLYEPWEWVYGNVRGEQRGVILSPVSTSPSPRTGPAHVLTPQHIYAMNYQDALYGVTAMGGAGILPQIFGRTGVFGRRS